MKKLWKQYSYAITLILLSFSLALLLSFKHHTDGQDKYMKIKITEGDSLWTISDQFAKQHSLSHAEFVSWVKKHNENISDQIYPGEEIIIPVGKNNSTVTTTELASAPEE
ncbi:cell division suppressor protein YneA [Neobacillus jeddahensis]|uniref:cell division suppressor protein YneA n=1 Tax=Neobacillus jeddahensis TaxID=1461580 RepID=UPI00058EC866|nr:LysM peptidoglycan-binding domain-containing protein [Neobacillus jeddahensis]